VRSPAENSGKRQDDLHIGGEGGDPVEEAGQDSIAVPFMPDQWNDLLRQASFELKEGDAFLGLGASHK
jgi:hypothetical protein